MIFEIFPRAAYERSFDMGDLPVELGVIILRNLDARSLFNAAKASRKWLGICLGDLVLRRRLRAEIQERKKKNLEILTRPGLSVTVTREEKSKPYGTNVAKTVKIRSDVRYEPYQRCAVVEALNSRKTGRKTMKGEKREVRKMLCRI